MQQGLIQGLYVLKMLHSSGKKRFKKRQYRFFLQWLQIFSREEKSVRRAELACIRCLFITYHVHSTVYTPFFNTHSIPSAAKKINHYCVYTASTSAENCIGCFRSKSTSSDVIPMKRKERFVVREKLDGVNI